MVDNIRNFELSLWFLTGKKLSCVLVCSSIFYNSKKWIQETVLSFVQKFKFNVQEHLKYWLWRLAILLWAEHKFNYGITGLRKAEKMSMMVLVLNAQARQQSMKILKKMILDWKMDQRNCIKFCVKKEVICSKRP